jgi:hypothetical protein
LALLVIVVVGVCIFFGMRLSPSRLSGVDPDQVYGLAPWDEWRLREGSPNPLQAPSAQQAQIANPLIYKMKVRAPDTDEQRGDIRLELQPGCIVSGRWYGQYYKTKPKRLFDLLRGDFGGWTYAAKVYRDKDGREDPNKLYFMAKGEFFFQETNFDDSTVKNTAGELYIRGWVDPNHAVSGYLTITSDEQYSENYPWKASEPGSGFGF